MQALNIIVFQHDPRLAQALTSTLSLHYHSVHVADSLQELRVQIPRYRADVAVMDVEASRLEDVKTLHREFPRTSIVCTHRVPDEQMWAAALNAGASDMCPATDTQTVAQSAERSVEQGRGQAAA
jgi:DNA-binding NarL/FixJ family response regulator